MFFPRLLGRALPALAVTLTTSALSASPAAADGHVCSGLPLTILPGTSDMAPRVCSVAAEAVARLESLGLTLDTDIEIGLTDQITDAPSACVALYDSALKRLEVLTPECLAEAHGGLGSFHDLPADVFFDSLVVHELTHVFLDETGAELNRTAHEYLAYAMQLDSLSDADRALVLGQTRVREPVEIEDFDELLLAFHPLRFAVMAWKHFDAAPDKRQLVAEILSGELEFPSLDDRN